MPKLYITGSNAEGRSCVVETRELSTRDLAVAPYAGDGPVPLLVKSTTRARLLKGHSEPGTFQTAIFTWRPGMYTDPHRTVSVDVDVVLQGSVILGLEVGEVTLRQGDVAVLPGVVHVWRATHEEALVLYTIQTGKWSEEDKAAETHDPMSIIHGM